MEAEELKVYQFTAGEASPAVYYGKGTRRDVIHHIVRLRRLTGHQFRAQRVAGEDLGRVERECNVRWLANDARIEAEHNYLNSVRAIYGDDVADREWQRLSVPERWRDPRPVFCKA